jgi:hypothetical protein
MLIDILDNKKLAEFKDKMEFAFSLIGFCGDRVGLDKDQEG